MKTRFALSLALVASAATPAFAEKQPEPPVPVTRAPASQTARPKDTPETEQRLYGPNNAPIIAPEKARQVIDDFRVAYEKMGRPRILFYVNRDLVDERSGLKLSGRTEQTESVQSDKKSSFERDPNAPAPASNPSQTQVNVAVGGNAGGNGEPTTPGKGVVESKGTKVTAENTYSRDDAAAPTLADRQTVREVERLFGRPFRIAGATLADQKVATALIADKPLDHFTQPTNDAARKDREALGNIADVVIEVLISSRDFTVSEVSGDRVASAPDIQVTAIKLTDSTIVGQASSSDILGKDPQAARIVRQFDVRDITEATALALMEDIIQSVRPDGD